MWITTAAQLAEKLPMTAEELAAVQSVADRYPMCITPYYLGLIDPNDPDDPIRKMAVPRRSKRRKAARLIRAASSPTRASPASSTNTCKPLWCSQRTAAPCTAATASESASLG